MERFTHAELEELRNRDHDRLTTADIEAWLEIYKRADELIAQIDVAFDGLTLGSGIGLWESNGIDNYCGEEELRTLREKDEKVDWRRIKAYDLNYCNAAPSFFDARGLYFHAPAFMTAELRGEFKREFISRLIYESFKASDEFRQLLTPEQRHVIIACISFYASIDECIYTLDDISNAMLWCGNQKRDEQ